MRVIMHRIEQWGLRNGVMPHRWHVRGGIVGWGYRYLRGPVSLDGQQREPRLQQCVGGWTWGMVQDVRHQGLRGSIG